MKCKWVCVECARGMDRVVVGKLSMILVKEKLGGRIFYSAYSPIGG